MKSVLMITNAFPPQTGGGVIRPSRLAKYLPFWGCKPIILTMTKGNGLNNIKSSIIPDNCEIYRTPSFDPVIFYAFLKSKCNLIKSVYIYFNKTKNNDNKNSYVKIRQNISNYIFIPDTKVLWIPCAFITGIYIILRKKPKTIFTMSPDASAHLVGYLLKHIFDIRWVVEFRDPWIDNPFRFKRPFVILEKIDQWLEKEVVTYSDHICVTSVEYKSSFLKRYNNICNDKISYIPNGFDPDDFKNIKYLKNKYFTILHAGSLYTYRSALNFIKAFFDVLKNNYDLRDSIRLVFVGNLDINSYNYIKNSIFFNNINILGYKPHNVTIDLMCNADILLLIPGPGVGTMPGKTYEYLKSGRPIYCLSDHGPCSNLITQSGAGIVEYSNKNKDISDSLYNFIINIKTNKLIYKCPENILQFYDRYDIARRVAKIL